MTQAPTPGPLSDDWRRTAVPLGQWVQIDLNDQAQICTVTGIPTRWRFVDAPTAPVEASGSEREADAWKWLGQLYPNDAPSDLAYDANEMVDAFLAGSGRSDRMAKALERIADEQQYRSGYCQTDITVEPALTAEEAQTVAREALAQQTAPRPQPSGETREIAWKILEEIPAINDLGSQFQEDIQAAIVTALEYSLHTQPSAKEGCVYVEVSGLTGTGKSAVTGEIEIALSALGLKVEHDAAFRSEKNTTHADWREALDLYKPVVVLRERNIARPLALGGQHSSGEDAAWSWLNRHVECDPADRDYSADEMVDAFMAGAGRYDIWLKALERIAGEQQHRSGYCQTDITVEPALTAEEAQTVARDALSTTPARAEAQDEGAAGEFVEPYAWIWRDMTRLGLGFTRDPSVVSIKREQGCEIQPLYAHPSPTPAADDDRVRIAVEAMQGALDWDKARGYRMPYRVRDPLYAAIDLAALKSTAAKEGGSK